jgi:hypothetical protein
MQGSTETKGGLMLTNTIGMKGTSTDSKSITAGINGLNTNVSGMSSDLRFWAGSNTWEDIHSAPFRVYDNGDVYGGSFYGFNNAFEINDDNIFDVCDWSVWMQTSSYTPNTNFKPKFKFTGDTIFINKLTTGIKAPNNINIMMYQFTFPTLTNLIGGTIKIYNPNGYLINSSTSSIASKTYCTLENFNESVAKTEISSFKGGVLSGTTNGVEYYYRWSVLTNSTSTLYGKYVECAAVPVYVPGGKTIPADLIPFLVSGNMNGNVTAGGGCIFMRWILINRY